MKNEFVKTLKENFENHQINLSLDDLRKLASKPFDELKEGMPFLPEGMQFPTEEDKRRIMEYLYGKS